MEEGTENANNLSKSAVGDFLDPTNAQDDGDCEDEGVHDHPDFLIKDPEELSITDVVKRENMYRDRNKELAVF